MTDHDALLAAILADPEEDLPRLVYADEIEASQPERAEFIRVQVELARMGADALERTSPYTRNIKAELQRIELRRREQDLFAISFTARPHHESWYPELPSWVCLPLPNWSRGFVSRVTCSWSDWSTHADAILRAQPIERVRLIDWLPILSGMVYLELPNGKRIMNGNRDIRKAHLAVAKVQWPRIAFELPPEPIRVMRNVGTSQYPNWEPIMPAPINLK